MSRPRRPPVPRDLSFTGADDRNVGRSTSVSSTGKAATKKVDVPTLVIHGDEQIVPFPVGGKRSGEIVADAALTVHRDRFQADLLAFVRSKRRPQPWPTPAPTRSSSSTASG